MHLPRPPHRDLQLYGFGVRLARRAARMDDLEGVRQALVMVETALELSTYRTGLTRAELKRQLDEAEVWAAAQPPHE